MGQQRDDDLDASLLTKMEQAVRRAYILLTRLNVIRILDSRLQDVDPTAQPIYLFNGSSRNRPAVKTYVGNGDEDVDVLSQEMYGCMFDLTSSMQEYASLSGVPMGFVPEMSLRWTAIRYRLIQPTDTRVMYGPRAGQALWICTLCQKVFTEDLVGTIAEQHEGTCPFSQYPNVAVIQQWKELLNRQRKRRRRR